MLVTHVLISYSFMTRLVHGPWGLLLDFSGLLPDPSGNQEVGATVHQPGWRDLGWGCNMLSGTPSSREHWTAEGMTSLVVTSSPGQSTPVETCQVDLLVLRCLKKRTLNIINEKDRMNLLELGTWNTGEEAAVEETDRGTDMHLDEWKDGRTEEVKGLDDLFGQRCSLQSGGSCVTDSEELCDRPSDGGDDRKKPAASSHQDTATHTSMSVCAHYCTLTIFFAILCLISLKMFSGMMTEKLKKSDSNR